MGRQRHVNTTEITKLLQTLQTRLLLYGEKGRDLLFWHIFICVYYMCLLGLYSIVLLRFTFCALAFLQIFFFSIYFYSALRKVLCLAPL